MKVCLKDSITFLLLMKSYDFVLSKVEWLERRPKFSRLVAL